MDINQIPEKIERYISSFQAWLENGSEEADMIKDMEVMVNEFDEWVEDSSKQWNNQNVPEKNFDDQLSQFQIFLDVRLEERASKLEDRIAKNRRELRTRYHPQYHDNLVNSMEETLGKFNTERTRIRNALNNAEESLDRNEKANRLESNLAEIEEREENRLDEMKNDIRNMKKICVRNNLMRAQKISNLLP